MELVSDGQGGQMYAPPSSPDVLRAMVPELFGGEDSVDLVLVMNRDSSNVSPADWSTIAAAIAERLDAYDGFIIAHGTDTLAYTATALALALGPDLPVPVVVTGAMTTPDILHGDGRINLLRAAAVARSDLAEVAVVFGDAILRGARTVKLYGDRYSAFDSPGVAPLGSVKGPVTLAAHARRRGHVSAGTGWASPGMGFAPAVIHLPVVPGTPPAAVSALTALPGLRGLVIEGFGKGNLPGEGAVSVVEPIEAALEAGIAVVVIGPFADGATLDGPYEPAVRVRQAGAIMVDSMTKPGALVKLRWALARADAALGAEADPQAVLVRIRSDMARNMVGELGSDPGFPG